MTKPLGRFYQIDCTDEQIDFEWVEKARRPDVLRVQVPEHFTKDQTIGALRAILDLYESKAGGAQ